MKKSNSPILNEDQHRALSSRLALLEQQLADAEIFLSGLYPKGEMFEITQDIPKVQTEEMLALFKQVREHIKKLRERFALTVQRATTTQKLAGSFGILWTILEDTHAAKLKGFGAVAPELSLSLDPEVDKIIDLINRMKERVFPEK